MYLTLEELEKDLDAKVEAGEITTQEADEEWHDWLSRDYGSVAREW